MLGDEEGHEPGDVFTPLAQRRHLDGQYIDAVEKIFAEIAVSDLFGEVAVGGADDAGIDFDRLGAADGIEGAVLECAEQFGLGFEWHFADFVEEQGAAVGHLHLAEMAFGRAGKGAFLVAKQFALEQLGGNGAAGQGDVGAFGAFSGGLNGAGEHVFSGSAFPGDEHGGVDVGGLPGHAHGAEE